MRKNRHWQHASADEIADQDLIDDQGLVEEIGVWTNKNFTYHNPPMGMLEELGEVCHCLLKRAQKIRGYDDPEKFRSEFADAAADFAIYAGHLAFLNPGIRSDYRLDSVPTELKADELIADLLPGLAPLFRSAPPAGQLFVVLSGISKLASLEGLKLREITFTTWEKVVSKRDWAANKT